MLKQGKGMEKKVYRSRISLLYVPIFGALLCSAWFTYKNSGHFAPLVIMGTITIFAVFSFNTIRYVITGKEIQIYYLWFRMGKIFISEIASIERSYNPLNATAASAKRLRLHFKRGYKWHVYFSNSPFLITILPSISPVREQDFFETLKTLNPNIQINVVDKKGWWRFWDWDI